MPNQYKSSGKVPRICEVCGAEFSAFPSLVKKGQGRFCGVECARTPVPIAKRIWRHIKKGDGCWPWTGSKMAKGYGRIQPDGGGKSPLLAHRVVYELTFGPIPEGMYVCHRCDNPSCCNPDHLFLGTAAENNADSRQKDRHVRGERQPAAKLTDAAVNEILGLIEAGESDATIARHFPVSQSRITRIRQGKAWTHIKRAS